MTQDIKVKTQTEFDDHLYSATQTQLIWRRFRKHKLAYYSGILLIALYFISFTFEFWVPYTARQQHEGFVNTPPVLVRVIDNSGNLQLPFVYGIQQEVNMDTFERIYVVDYDTRYGLQFFSRGDSYRLFGLVRMNIHFVRVEEPGKLFLLGTDNLGRDVFTRILAGSRISLTIGLVGVVISFVLGSLLGGISGFYGGYIDIVIMRFAEILTSIPKIPLWITLAAIIPLDWPIARVYLGITAILSLMSWPGLARVIRAKLLELREQDYVTAAKIAGASDLRVIVDHLLPAYLSVLIVHLTLAIPGMILAETSLSFLGLGMRPPAVSWGTLLESAQNISSIALYPWLLTPAIPVIITVLLFNFVGDGLRDAADPYKQI